MNELTIRPTAKFLKAGAIAAALAFLGLEIGCLLAWNQAAGSHWIMVIPVLILLWPAARVMRRTFTRTIITADRLRYETGMIGKTTRNMPLANLQDVRVDQRLVQRMFNVGDLSIETAGETSRLVIPNVDGPQALADEIMNRGQNSAPQRRRGTENSQN